MRAQTTLVTAVATPIAALTAIDASAFPAVQAFAQVSDAAGLPVAGLPASAFTLTENGQPAVDFQASEADVGVQVVFAIDSGAVFKGRDANGVTRLAYIQQALADFAINKPWMQTGIDDVTVTASESPVVEHSNDGRAVASAVAGYQSTFTGVADPFTLVNSALDFASDATRRPGMRRFVVFISGGLQNPNVQGPVADVASRAKSVGVPIYTVYVGPVGAGNTLPAQNLKKLADATGGQALILETPQSLTPLFQAIAAQGRQYQLSYRSALAVTGQNKLVLVVKLPNGASVTSNEAAFPLRVEAPHVTLGSLPPSLVRVAPSAGAAPAAASPAEYDVPLTIDFPDGHARVLKLVQLLVDGQVVATQSNTSTVTSLVWPLTSYAADAPHHLQARVIDELGLAAESALVDVSVSLQVPAGLAPLAVPPAAAAVANANWPLLALAGGGVLLVVGAVVGGGAWLVRSRRPPEPAPVPTRPQARVARRAPAPVPPAAMTEDITIPVIPASRSLAEGGAPAGTLANAGDAARRLGRRGLPHVALSGWHWPGRHSPAGPRGAAFLQVVEPGGGAPAPNIELLSATLNLGRDGAVAETVFYDRSVSRLHARIVAEDSSTFRIFDSGSTSGTWVNYTPVPATEGHLLQDGDLINLGRVQLRFKCRDQAPAAGNGPRVALVAAVAAPATPAAAALPAARVETLALEQLHKDGA